MLLKTITTFLAVAVSAMAPVPSEAANGRVNFNCYGSSTCYFTVFFGSGISNFTLSGGESYVFNGVVYGDTYCFNTKYPNNPNTCPQKPIPREHIY